MKKNIYLLFLLIPLQLKPTDSFNYNVLCGVIDCFTNKATGCLKTITQTIITNACPKPHRTNKNKTFNALIAIQPKNTIGRQSPQSGTGNIASEEDSATGFKPQTKKKTRRKKRETPQDIESDSDDGGLWIEIGEKEKAIQLGKNTLLLHQQ